MPSTPSAPRAIDIPLRVIHRGEVYRLEPPSRWLNALNAALARGDVVDTLRAVLGPHALRYFATAPTYEDGVRVGAQVVLALAARGIHLEEVRS